MKNILLILTAFIISACNNQAEIFNNIKNENVKLSSQTEVKNFTTFDYNQSHLKPNVKADYKFKISDFINIGTSNLTDKILKNVPVIKDDVLYAIDATSNLTAYNLKNKTLIYSVKLDNTDSTGGLVISNNVLFASLSNGKILKINKENGKVFWESFADCEIKASPVADNNNVYIQTTNNDILSFNQKNGKKEELFISLGEQLNYPLSSTPALSNNSIISGLSTGNAYSVSKNKEINWKAKTYIAKSSRSPITENSIISSPIIDQNYVYISSLNSVGKYALSTGKIIWQKEIGASKTPVISGNTIFFMASNNTLHALNKENGDIFWTTQFKGKNIIFSGICIANDNIIIFDSNNNLYEISAKNGKIVKQIDAKYSTYLSPICLSDKLVIINPYSKVVVYK